MRIINKKRFIKTVIYRFTTTIVAQTVSWLITRDAMINTIVLITDVASTIWYYGFESCFETLYKKVKKKWTRK